MFYRHRNLLALVAALGVLLHAGTAAAQIFCAMAGVVTTSCACADEPGADMTIGPMDGDCCRDALEAPATDRIQEFDPLPEPMEAAAWAQVIPPVSAPALAPAPLAAAPPSSSLRALQTVVLQR